MIRSLRLPRAVKLLLLWPLSVLAILLLIAATLYVPVRYYHVDNRLQRWAQGLDRQASPLSTTAEARFAGYGYDIEGRAIDGLDRNLSGLTYLPDQHQLVGVVNRPATLVRLSLDGQLISRHQLHGMADTEGIAYLGHNRVAITLEGRHAIALLDLPDVAKPDIAAKAAEYYPLGPAQSGNSGIEGLAYAPARDSLFLAKEKHPRALYELPAVQALRSGSSPALIDHSNWLEQTPYLTDLSSLEIDPNTGHLLALSDESQALVEFDTDSGAVQGHLDLTPSNWLQHRPAPQPEGVAIDEQGTLYVVSEPNLFYRLQPRPQRAPRDSETVPASP